MNTLHNKALLAKRRVDMANSECKTLHSITDAGIDSALAIWHDDDTTLTFSEYAGIDQSRWALFIKNTCMM